MSCNAPIGVFDSGLGGITVLKAIKAELPKENLIYLADKYNAPYGTKSDEQILKYTRAGAQTLIKQGVKAIVIACNTATSVAAEALRAELDMSVIGLEPAIKPAFFSLNSTENGKILVLATPVTLSHPKFCRLIDLLGRDKFVSVPAPCLVEYIENGIKSREQIASYLNSILAPYRGIEFSACVLGCTHFPFVKNEILNALSYEVKLFDGANGAARELKHQLEIKNLLCDHRNAGKVAFMTEYPDNIQERLFLGNF